jgi:hypothetical protein
MIRAAIKANNDPKKRTQDEKDLDASGINNYVRTMYRQRYFPSVDDNGAVYLSEPGKVGNASKKSREYLEGDNLTEHLLIHFPHGSTHYATPPEARAMRRKMAGTQTTITSHFL